MANFPAYNPYQPMMYGQQMGQPYPTYPAQMPAYQPTMQQPMMQQGMQPAVQQQVQPTAPQQAQQQAQQQTAQQQTALSGIRGRVVSTASEIMPNEVPMDGMPSFFPQQDMSCIYVKVWDSEGKLKPTRYVREPDEPVQQAQQHDNEEAFADITERLGRIESFLTLMASPKRPVPASKKDRVIEDE